MSRLAERIRTRKDRNSAFWEETRDPLALPPGVPSPAAAYLAGLAAGSQVTQGAALRVLAELLGHRDPLACPWHRLTYAHTAALRAQLAGRYAPATANRLLSVLRGVLLAARRLGLISADEHARLTDLPPVRGVAAPRGRMLDQAELAALLRVVAGDASIRGRRDAALLAAGVAGGLRRAELAALDLGDVAADGAVHVRRGKGAKDRTVYLAGDALGLLDVWRRVRAEHPGPALFVKISRAGRPLERLSPAGIRTILLRRCEEAGVAPATPHDLRRTCISRLLDEGVDLATAARVAGHASTDTTAAYDRRGERALRDAALRVGKLG